MRLVPEMDVGNAAGVVMPPSARRRHLALDSTTTDMSYARTFEEAVHERKSRKKIVSFLVRNIQLEIYEDDTPVSSSIQLAVLR